VKKYNETGSVHDRQFGDMLGLNDESKVSVFYIAMPMV